MWLVQGHTVPHMVGSVIGRKTLSFCQRPKDTSRCCVWKQKNQAHKEPAFSARLVRASPEVRRSLLLSYTFSNPPTPPHPATKIRVFLFYFQTGSPVAQAGLELTMQMRMTYNLRSFCLHLQGNGMMVVLNLAGLVW